MTDLTDRYNELSESTSTPSLEEQWDENPEPEVGSPSDQTIVEGSGDVSYVLNTHNYREILKYTGETMDIER